MQWTLPVSPAEVGRLLYQLRRSTPHSEAQYGSLAGFAVNDCVIARRFYSGQFDFQKRHAVVPDTAQPLNRTIKINPVHVEERVHQTLLRGGLTLQFNGADLMSIREIP